MLADIIIAVCAVLLVLYTGYRIFKPSKHGCCGSGNSCGGNCNNCCKCPKERQH